MYSTRRDEGACLLFFLGSINENCNQTLVRGFFFRRLVSLFKTELRASTNQINGKNFLANQIQNREPNRDSMAHVTFLPLPNDHVF